MRVSLLVVATCVSLSLGLGASRSGADADARDPAPPGSASGVQLSARYASSVLVFKVGEITLNAQLGPNGYAADGYIEAAGLAALFTDFDIRAEVRGSGVNGEREPAVYGHVERTGSKIRSVRVDFGGPVARSEVVPPFGSLGVPPASEADRTHVIDPITAFFELSRRLEGGAGCTGRLPVFDGKARYDLRLETVGRERVRTRGWRGEALICQAWYEPISGYDPEDYPSESELRHPLVLWLAPVAGDGAYLPVRLHTRAGFGGVTIELIELEVSQRAS